MNPACLNPNKPAPEAMRHHPLYESSQVHHQLQHVNSQPIHHHQHLQLHHQHHQQQQQVQFHNQQQYVMQRQVPEQKYVANELKPELSPLMNEDPFMLGYMECTHEAIRYLTQDEGLSEDHPMVVGLKQHLFEQQRLVYIQYVLRTTLQLPGNNHGDHNHSAPAKVEDSDVQAIQHIPGGVVENRSVNQTEHKNDEMNETDKERLAAQLAEEIFSLLQNDTEYSEDEYLDDSDDDLVDEGFEEELNVES